ncbi:MAG: hypothetical protein NVS2B12_28120 [Ktedonobacteraceae bacterium]
MDFAASLVVSEKYGRAARWGAWQACAQESWSVLLRALKCSDGLDGSREAHMRGDI